MEKIFKITLIFNLLLITNNSFSMLAFLTTIKSIYNSKKLTPVKTSAQLKEEITKLEILPKDLENLIIDFANPEYEEYYELCSLANDNQDDINILKEVCAKSKLLIGKLTGLKFSSMLIENVMQLKQTTLKRISELIELNNNFINYHYRFNIPFDELYF